MNSISNNFYFFIFSFDLGALFILMQKLKKLKSARVIKNLYSQGSQTRRESRSDYCNQNK